MDKEYEAFKLKNGFKVLIVPRADSDLIHVAVDIVNGRVIEHYSELSYTHVGEHLLAMFTSPRHWDFHKLTHQLGQLGSLTNAYTDTFTTGYWLEGRRQNTTLFMQLLADMFFRYEFYDDWEKQKNIVLEELKMRSTYAWVDLDELENRVLYDQHRLGVGWKQELANVQRASLNDVLRYNRHLLNPRCALLSIEGNIPNVHQLKKQIVALFDQPGLSTFVPRVPAAPGLYSKNGPVVKHLQLKNVNTGRIVMVFQHSICTFDAANVAKLTSLLRYFSDGYFSRLYQVLREQKGLVYGVSDEQFYSPVPDKICSYVRFVINVDPQNIDEVLHVVHNEIRLVKEKLIDAENFLRIRNVNEVFKSNQILDKRLGKYSDWYGANILWGKRVTTFENYYDLFKQVTPEDIQSVAQRVLDVNRSLVLVARPDK